MWHTGLIIFLAKCPFWRSLLTFVPDEQRDESVRYSGRAAFFPVIQKAYRHTGFTSYTTPV
jgi:hypothetical protein